MLAGHQSINVYAAHACHWLTQAIFIYLYSSPLASLILHNLCETVYVRFYGWTAPKIVRKSKKREKKLTDPKKKPGKYDLSSSFCIPFYGSLFSHLPTYPKATQRPKKASNTIAWGGGEIKKKTENDYMGNETWENPLNTKYLWK